MGAFLKQSLTTQIVIAALFAWAATQLLPVEKHTLLALSEPLSLIKLIYLGLLKAIVGIMVMFSLIEGISNIGSLVRLKQIGSVAVVYYLITTTIAICIGLGAALMMPEWTPLTSAPPPADSVTLIDDSSAQGVSILNKLLSMALMNPIAALSGGNLLAIVTFSILIAIALLATLDNSHPVFEVVKGINQSISTLVSGIIRLAPFAVFAIVFELTIESDSALFSQLFEFGLLVFGLTMIHSLVVLPVIAKLATGTSPISLFKAISAPMSMALATSSSSATLPLSLQTAKEKLGVSDSTSSLVLPMGAVMNMDGTALFEGVAAVFLAQLFGTDLSTGAIVMIFLMAMVSSVGAPGMPSGSMSGMQLVLLAAGIPLEAIAILLIIERPLDTFRTAVNVQGDLIGAMVVDRWSRRHTEPEHKHAQVNS